MAINQKLVQLGACGGTAINVDMARLESSAVARVTLSANYAIICGPGIPSRPDNTGAASASLEYPRTIVSGTQLHLLAAEAAALVAAGKAAYS